MKTTIYFSEDGFFAIHMFVSYDRQRFVYALKEDDLGPLLNLFKREIHSKWRKTNVRIVEYLTKKGYRSILEYSNIDEVKLEDFEEFLI